MTELDTAEPDWTDWVRLDEAAPLLAIGTSPDTGEVHVVHGPGYPCYITQGLCACCACTTCQQQRTVLDQDRDVVQRTADGQHQETR